MKEFTEFISYFIAIPLDKQQKIVDSLLIVLQSNQHKSLIHQIPKDKKQLNCPHCTSKEIQAYGKNKGVQRYRCKSCCKYFSETTGTPLAWLRKKDKWPEYLHCMLQGYSLRKSATQVGINLKTSFDWRHKILSAFKTVSPERFASILESDDIFFLESEKGSRKLNRKARKRGGKAKTAGISNEQVAVVVSRDRRGHADMNIATRGRISKKNLDDIYGNRIEDGTVLCSDSHRSYAAFARSKGLTHEKIIANKGQYIKDRIFHVQHVNNMAQRLRRWMRKFNGVATKYLQNYLNWFLVLEKLKDSSQKMTSIAGFALSTNQAWFDFKKVAINQI